MENKIDQILQSGDKLPNLNVPEDLMSRLLEIPSEVKQQVQALPSRLKWMAAAGIAAVLILNTFLVLYYNTNAIEGSDLTENYFSYLNQL